MRPEDAQGEVIRLRARRMAVGWLMFGSGLSLFVFWSVAICVAPAAAFQLVLPLGVAVLAVTVVATRAADPTGGLWPYRMGLALALVLCAGALMVSLGAQEVLPAVVVITVCALLVWLSSQLKRRGMQGVPLVVEMGQRVIGILLIAGLFGVVTSLGLDGALRVGAVLAFAVLAWVRVGTIGALQLRAKRTLSTGAFDRALEQARWTVDAGMRTAGVEHEAGFPIHDAVRENLPRWTGRQRSRWLNLAMRAAADGDDLERARAIAEELIALDPDTAALQALALAELRAGNASQAKGWVETALVLRRQTAPASTLSLELTEAWIAALSGDRRVPAIEARLGRLAPLQAAQCRLILGRVYSALGDVDQAHTQWSQAAKIGGRIGAAALSALSDPSEVVNDRPVDAPAQLG